MLQEMRENSRSAIIYVLFGILIAAFVISFGPQSGQTGSYVLLMVLSMVLIFAIQFFLRK